VVDLLVEHMGPACEQPLDRAHPPGHASGLLASGANDALMAQRSSGAALLCRYHSYYNHVYPLVLYM
jgi:hypothetical protein